MVFEQFEHGASQSIQALLSDYQTESIVWAKPRQAAANAAMVRQFLGVAGIDSPAEITPTVVQSHVASILLKGLSKKTACNHAAAISGYCRWLADGGYLPANPCRMVRLPDPPEPEMLYLEGPERIEAMRIAVECGIFCEVGLAIYTGLRRSELRLLRWCHVDQGGRIIQVVNAKNRRSRSVPLNTKAMAILAMMQKRTGGRNHVFASFIPDRSGPRGNRWWNEALAPLQGRMRKFQILAPGTTGRGWHMFRHTFATMCLRAGVDLITLKNWLGHSDLSMVERYAHIVLGYDPSIERL